MIDKKHIQLVLEHAINTPSGSNSQPWSFIITKESKLQICIHPEKDHKILNCKNRGTLMALGALLKNIEHASHAQGFSIHTSDFDHATNSIDVVFSELSIPQECHLDSYIEKRTTNRKSYKNTPLTTSEKESLATAAISENVIYTSVFESDVVEKSASAFAVFEKIMIEADGLRSHSFQEIVWSEKEARADNSGLYIKTLELAPPQRVILKLLQSSSLAVRLAKKVHLPNIIEADTAKKYASGPEIGVLLVRDLDNNFIEAGKIFENIWLQVTALDLSLQPLVGILFLKQYIDTHDSFFSPEHRSEINEAYATLCEIYKVPEGYMIAVAFRIGHSDPPSEITKKAPPNIIFE